MIYFIYNLYKISLIIFTKFNFRNSKIYQDSKVIIILLINTIMNFFYYKFNVNHKTIKVNYC